MARTVKIVEHETDEAVGDPTVEWYDVEAETYFASTVDLSLAALWAQFLDRVPVGGRILDAGSGSGRDTRVFKDRGFLVDAFDASAALARLSSAYTGQQTRVARFSAWNGPPNYYDGIWAFASLLHVPRRQLPEVINRLAASLKPGGIFFASFKVGAVDSVDGRGRCFTNLTPSQADLLFRQLGVFDDIQLQANEAPAAHGEVTRWLYILARSARRPVGESGQRPS